MQPTTILYFLFLFVLVSGCNDEMFLPALEDAEAPSELSLDFSITPDNTGTTTIRPGGRGVTSFSVDFGDGGSAPVTLAPGASITHVYPEGVYTVSLEAMNINGETTSYSEELTVSFQAPENLEVTVVPTPGNPLSIDVSATADLETNFLAYFGEDPDEEPVSFQEGETVSHEYAATGTYEVRVAALSGGSARVEDTVTVTIDNPVLLPLTFEDPTKTYTFIGFGGATAEVVDNPDASGINTSARVGKLTKSQGSEVWAGTVFELGAPIDFSETQQLSMKVWSPQAGISVLLKLENATDGDIFAEVTVNTTVADQWEELTFDFSGADLGQSYSKLVLFFDFGTAGTGADYYFDEVALTGGRPEVSLPLTFESTDLTYEWIGFGGATAEIVDNPDARGLNISGRVGKLNKSEGSEVWAGAVLQLPRPIDFTAGNQIAVKVWSPQAGIPVLLKLENADNPDIFLEVTVNTTVANQWEELTFDLSGADLSRDYAKVVLFFDFGTAGTGADYYFDDIRLAGGSEPTELVLPLTFESTDQTYPFSGFGGASAEVIDNPDASGLNPSNRVVKLNKGQGSEVWAGAVIALSRPIDFAGRQTARVKVWSPRANIPVLFKLENGTDGNVFLEATANTTVANQWEELTFDLSGADLSRDYSKVVLFFDFGTAGTGTDYYFDDIRLTQ
ncbi:hypothetical protein GGR26_001634 [Lewinella marina]|uniref:PKD/Chitinase domain-containing protein n=1 Tax=Neolewinella marina TaxID=438751 RepID=A0A2G0CAV9_9BACT|nr:PKD domain-containing protein [Neolewinella marina]NJB85866.1 hypothetical protein [Neolewinella marina]PHK97104.1 hypothetical protein CGL56_17650 [Neolewinella marina]